MGRIRSISGGIEILCVVSILLAGVHFVHERIASKYVPDGDEGSWMGTAAQVARGEGFTIRSLEWPFLKPLCLPRPNDTRFPAFVGILAIVFKVSGISYENGLLTSGVLFLLFALTFYFAVRREFGIRCAIISFAGVLFSLNQLQWGTGVCTEGLYGLGLSLFVLLRHRFPATGRYHWVFLGTGLGILWLIRPNTVLFVPALFIYWWIKNRKKESRLQDLLVACGTMLIICGPWMVRTTMFFGNPLHGGQWAGLFRATEGQPLNYSPGQFLAMNGVLFPVKALGLGIGQFFYVLHFHERGLEVLPIIGVCIGALRRKPFFTPLIAAGFIFSFLMCAYICYHAWAAIRLFSPFLPFIYAYGIAALLDETKQLFRSDSPVFRLLFSGVVLTGLIVPVFNPHRYYERFYSRPNPKTFSIESHFRLLAAEIDSGECYWAGNAGQLNFMGEFNCVMVSSYFDAAWTDSIISVLPPVLCVFSDSEKSASGILVVLAALYRHHCRLLPVGRNGDVAYYRIENCLSRGHP